MIIPINDVWKYGVTNEGSLLNLPIPAWTRGENVRFQTNQAERILGESAAFFTPTISPRFLMPVPTATAYWWVYAGTAKVYATEGASEYNITRTVGGDYTATDPNPWTGTALGGVPVLNNGTDAPQFWSPVSGGQALANLTNWPASTTCKALRSYKQYLIALDVTKSGTRYPNLVKWSHPADPGAVPSSWDETDETKDAGEYPLGDSGGFCVDCLPLGDANFIYKDDSIWAQQWIGGINVFKFVRKSSQTGLLARNAVVEITNNRHAAFCNDDILIHDGQTFLPLLTQRAKASVYNAIDPTNYERAFTVHIKAQNEVWFCYPEQGETFCTRAVVWNYLLNTISFRDLPNLSHAASGVVNSSAESVTWDSDSATWDSDTSVWDERLYNPTTFRTLMSDATNGKFLLADDTNQFNSTSFTSLLERVGIGFPLGVDAPPDFTTMKFLRGLWPRFTGTPGAQVAIDVGTQETVNGPVSWTGPYMFTIGTDLFVDVLLSSRIFALRISSSGNHTWQFGGYEVDIVPSGGF